MIIFRDVVTNDEVMTDTFKLQVVGDVMYKFPATWVTEDGEITGYGDEEDLDTGGNTEKVLDVVKNHNLKETAFADKKEYQLHMKGFMGRVKAHLQKTQPDFDINAWQANVLKFLKDEILGKWDDWQFYYTSSYNPEGLHLLARYEGDDTFPTFYVWKEALISEKL